MNTTSTCNIVIIGSGNIATSLALALYTAQHTIKQVYSYTLKHAQLLAQRVNAEYANESQKLYPDADLYIIAVPDREIENVLKVLHFGKSLVVHTSGSTPMQIFDGYVSNYAVLYPLQTFSKEKPIVNFSDIPIFVEASNNSSLVKVKQLAASIAQQVIEINSQQRLALHVSAVLACNFVNHLLALATDVMHNNGLDKQWLVPLIRETIDKALAAQHPGEVQTGPAVRCDKLTLERHTEFLAQHPQKSVIYRMLSESIMKYNDKSKYE